jgi:hypothetical protein
MLACTCRCLLRGAFSAPYPSPTRISADVPPPCHHRPLSGNETLPAGGVAVEETLAASLRTAGLRTSGSAGGFAAAYDGTVVALPPDQVRPT